VLVGDAADAATPHDDITKAPWQPHDGIRETPWHSHKTPWHTLTRPIINFYEKSVTSTQILGKKGWTDWDAIFGMDKLERRGYNMQKESRRYPFRLDWSLFTGVFNVYIVVFIKLS